MVINHLCEFIVQVYCAGNGEEGIYQGKYTLWRVGGTATRRIEHMESSWYCYKENRICGG